MLRDANPIVLLLIVITALVTYKGFKDYSFFERYKFQVNRILNGDKIRMMSSGFLHADWLHFAFNMYALLLFGNIVAGRLGNLYFIIIYFGSLLAGSLYSLFYHKKESYYSAIGASGAVSGIVYACILIYPQMELSPLFLPIPIPGYIIGVAYMLYTIYGMKKRVGNIGHSAHLGGAIGGYALVLLLHPIVFQTNTVFVMILSVPIILLVLFGNKLNV